jgi:uncharacterized protein involved in exopolysaccharide biosynthesis
MSDPSVTSQNPVPQNPSSNWRWRWWKASLPIGLMLAVGAVAFVWLLFEPQYEAAALLEITERPEYIAFEPKEVDKDHVKAYFRTQMEIIKSHWILGCTVAKDEVQQLPEFVKIRTQKVDPIDWLKKRVSVVSPSDSDLFEIRYSSADPKNAALVVNAITRQYLTAQEEEAANRAKKLVDALAEEMASRKKLVGTLRRQVHSATPAVSSDRELARPDTNSLEKNLLVELQNRLVAVQVEHAVLSARIKASEAELLAKDCETSSAVPLSDEEIKLRNSMVQKAIDDSTEVKLWYSLLIPKQILLLQIETTAEQGKQDPSYVKLQKEITKIEQKLDELKQKLAVPVQNDVEFSLRAKRGASQVAIVVKRREELARMKTELRSYEIAEINLRQAYAAELKQSLTEFDKLSGENVNLTFMKDELAEAEKVLKRITERQTALQTERAAPPRVIWHHPADAPLAPVEEIPYRDMAIAGAGAFLLPYAVGLILLTLWYLRKLIHKLLGEDASPQNPH